MRLLKNRRFQNLVEQKNAHINEAGELFTELWIIQIKAKASVCQLFFFTFRSFYAP